MDLLRALSNPDVRVKLAQLAKLSHRLLSEAPATMAPIARPPARAGELVQTVTAVLADAGRPMQVAEVREAVEHRLGHPLSQASIKACLSEYTLRPSPRFERIERGVYRSVRR